MTIYDALIEKAHLTVSHRTELKKKRGFTEKIIDEMRFVSGGEYLKPILEQMKNEFDEEVLIQSGLFYRPKQTSLLIPSDQLFDDRVIIPYLNREGEVTLIRPHKLGLPGVQIQIYCDKFLQNSPKHIVITEGEFKAVALYQWGIPAIAIPGVSSFAGKHFEKLKDELQAAGVESVTIIFDNEIKDDPKFPNYKEKPEDRWDTPYWAYIMAYKLSKERIQTNIGILPDEWRVDGKIDFDGALAQGHTKHEIEAVIKNALHYSEFIDTLPDEGQKIVRRKIARYFYKSPIKREYNKYVITRAKGENIYEEVISNFVIDIKASFYGPDGCFRHVQLINEFGEKSELFVLEPAEMAGINEFKKFCFSKGNYVFEGTGSDLTEIWKYELGRDMGDMIRMPEMIGEIQPGFWLYGNVAVKDGEVFIPDQDGIFWVDGVGYKPQSLAVGESSEDLIPALYITNDPAAPSIETISEILYESIGGYQAYVAVGWVLATIFSRVIFKEFKAFPFLFLHGKRQAGKSTLARWLMSFFGVETEGYNLPESTQNFIMRALGYYSSIPAWFDEYRNEPRVTAKDGYFRSAWNRQLSGKGIKSGFGAKSYKVNSTVLITGEELPKDNGLYTRLIPLQISENKRDREHYDWLNKKCEKFSAVTFDLIKRYSEVEKELVANIKDLKAVLIEKDIPDRTAENWAIAVGAFYTLVKEDDNLIKWALEACQDVRETAENEHILNVFLEDLILLYADYKIDDRHVKADIEAGTRVLYIWYPAVYSIWSEYFRRKTGREPFDRISIVKYLKDEASFVREISSRLKSESRKCLMFNVDKGSEAIKELYNNIINRQNM